MGVASSSEFLSESDRAVTSGDRSDLQKWSRTMKDEIDKLSKDPYKRELYKMLYVEMSNVNDNANTSANSDKSDSADILHRSLSDVTEPFRQTSTGDEGHHEPEVADNALIKSNKSSELSKDDSVHSAEKRSNDCTNSSDGAKSVNYTDKNPTAKNYPSESRAPKKKFLEGYLSSTAALRLKSQTPTEVSTVPEKPTSINVSTTVKSSYPSFTHEQNQKPDNTHAPDERQSRDVAAEKASSPKDHPPMMDMQTCISAIIECDIVRRHSQKVQEEKDNGKSLSDKDPVIISQHLKNAGQQKYSTHSVPAARDHVYVEPPTVTKSQAQDIQVEVRTVVKTGRDKTDQSDEPGAFQSWSKSTKHIHQYPQSNEQGRIETQIPRSQEVGLHPNANIPANYCQYLAPEVRGFSEHYTPMHSMAGEQVMSQHMTMAPAQYLSSDSGGQTRRHFIPHSPRAPPIAPRATGPGPAGFINSVQKVEPIKDSHAHHMTTNDRTNVYSSEIPHNLNNKPADLVYPVTYPHHSQPGDTSSLRQHKYQTSNSRTHEIEHKENVARNEYVLQSSHQNQEMPGNLRPPNPTTAWHDQQSLLYRGLVGPQRQISHSGHVSSYVLPTHDIYKQPIVLGAGQGKDVRHAAERYYKSTQVTGDNVERQVRADLQPMSHNMLPVTDETVRYMANHQVPMSHSIPTNPAVWPKRDQYSAEYSPGRREKQSPLLEKKDQKFDRDNLVPVVSQNSDSPLDLSTKPAENDEVIITQVTMTDDKDSPLDLTVKKPAKSVSGNNQGSRISAHKQAYTVNSHGYPQASTHIKNLEDTMIKHMESVKQQPYHPTILLKSPGGNMPYPAASFVTALTPPGVTTTALGVTACTPSASTAAFNKMLPHSLPPGTHPMDAHGNLIVPTFPNTIINNSNMFPSNLNPVNPGNGASGSHGLPRTSVIHRPTVTPPTVPFKDLPSVHRPCNTESATTQPTNLTQNVPTRTSLGNLRGDHPPNDILFVKCVACGSTYGSLHSFKKHFLRAHGHEPSRNDRIIESISATRDALRKEGYRGRQIGLESLNMLPSNNYYENQLARYRFQNQSGLDEPSRSEDIMEVVGERVETLSDNAIRKRATVQDMHCPVIDDKNRPVAGVQGELASSQDRERSRSPLDDEHTTMKCLQCGLEFPTRDWGVFRRHVRTHEIAVDGPFRCGVCRQAFRDAQRWRIHLSTSHTMHSCVCKICEIGFSHLGALNKHLQTAHHSISNPDVEYKCLYCDRTFSNQDTLYLHTMDHERRYNVYSREQMPGEEGRTNDTKTVTLHQDGHSVVRKASPDSTYREDRSSSRGPALANTDQPLLAKGGNVTGVSEAVQNAPGVSEMKKPLLKEFHMTEANVRNQQDDITRRQLSEAEEVRQLTSNSINVSDKRCEFVNKTARSAIDGVTEDASNKATAERSDCRSQDDAKQSAPTFMSAHAFIHEIVENSLTDKPSPSLVEYYKKSENIKRTKSKVASDNFRSVIKGMLNDMVLPVGAKKPGNIKEMVESFVTAELMNANQESADGSSVAVRKTVNKVSDGNSVAVRKTVNKEVFNPDLQVIQQTTSSWSPSRASPSCSSKSNTPAIVTTEKPLTDQQASEESPSNETKPQTYVDGHDQPNSSVNDKSVEYNLQSADQKPFVNDEEAKDKPSALSKLYSYVLSGSVEPPGERPTQVAVDVNDSSLLSSHPVPQHSTTSEDTNTSDTQRSDNQALHTEQMTDRSDNYQNPESKSSLHEDNKDDCYKQVNSAQHSNDDNSESVLTEQAGDNTSVEEKMVRQTEEDQSPSEEDTVPSDATIKSPDLPRKRKFSVSGNREDDEPDYKKEKRTM